MTTQPKKTYKAPSLKTWGNVANLTQTGLTRPGGDAKDGSVLSEGE